MKINLFFICIPSLRESGRAISGAKGAGLLHDSAWSLLAASLKTMYPDSFTGEGIASLPPTETGIHGKPGFRDKSLPQFSLSHSGSLAVCAISDCGPVGVDVQEKRDMSFKGGEEKIARRFFHKREQEYYYSFEDMKKRRQVFFTIFSCKEAYVKLTGKGMYEDFRSFYTSFDHKGFPQYICEDKTGKLLAYPVYVELPGQSGSCDYVLVSCAHRPHSVILSDMQGHFFGKSYNNH